ncbi:hypothetical protein FAF44_44630 [Nonomuraea sp. MG754425]|uniref:pPIWI_RE_Y domain-containing protein n=1 Tax=Nonomuraea sp. MG754425 TaxID=2570319 RepID=UPI001F42F3FA|nr:hypothetical protein [Nonomuraea sp. MG754425]MCF6475398.1 hypothetical protein [Nonomuraea sp. MG754425]
MTADTLPDAAADWAAYQGIPLVRTLAGAMLALDAQTGLDAFTLPYPPEAQRALDRTVLACLLREATSPASLTELVSWCKEVPLADWPVDLPADAIGPEDRLLDADSGRPTELCHEWAERTRDSALAFRDREIIHTALRLCRAFGEEEAYTAFRGLLVNRPVLTAPESFEVLNDLVLEPVHELIRRIYLPVPDSYRYDGEYVCCGRCLTLLTPVHGGEWWCERDRCRRQGPAPLGRRLRPEEMGEVHQVERPVRQFVTGPGRAEAALEKELTALGLAVRMWPGYDAYDLLVTFPNGHRWAIDVKDWANPLFLGRSARLVPKEPPYDEAFWVVPHHRVAARRDYVSVYERNRPSQARDLPLLTDTDLIRRARAQVRKHKGDIRA